MDELEACDACRSQRAQTGAICSGAVATARGMRITIWSGPRTSSTDSAVRQRLHVGPIQLAIAGLEGQASNSSWRGLMRTEISANPASDFGFDAHLARARGRVGQRDQRSDQQVAQASLAKPGNRCRAIPW